MSDPIPAHTCDTDVPNNDPAPCSICGALAPAPVPLVVPSYPEAIPAAPGHPGDVVTLLDTPEVRAGLEAHAIPKCRAWREANPEISPEIESAHGHPGLECLEDCPDEPAPYCCSAYCPRCLGLRALDGAKPLRPNEWMLND